jgi:putative sigma-54 modulation protein
MIKLSIKGTNLKLEQGVYSYIEEKIGGIDKFIGGEDSALQGWVEVGLITKHHQSGDIYRAEVQIRLSGKSLRAEATAKDIYSAIDAVKDELRAELKKHKGKAEAIHKKGARLLKNLWKRI